MPIRGQGGVDFWIFGPCEGDCPTSSPTLRPTGTPTTTRPPTLPASSKAPTALTQHCDDGQVFCTKQHQEFFPCPLGTCIEGEVAVTVVTTLVDPLPAGMDDKVTQAYCDAVFLEAASPWSQPGCAVVLAKDPLTDEIGEMAAEVFSSHVTTKKVVEALVSSAAFAELNGGTALTPADFSVDIVETFSGAQTPPLTLSSASDWPSPPRHRDRPRRRRLKQSVDCQHRRR